MIEGSIFSVGKMYISAVLILLIVGLSILLFQVNQSNNFKQYVNYQIERGGGLTSEVIERVNNYSEDHFNGIFYIDPTEKTTQKPYGTTVEYVIQATFEIPFFQFEVLNIAISGSSITLTR